MSDWTLGVYSAEILISLAGVAVSLIIDFSMGALVCFKMRSHPNTGRTINYMFFVSLLLAIMGTTSMFMIYFITNDVLDRALVYTLSISSLSFMLSLMMTLVLRLHLTFKDSAYRMSSRTIQFFAFLCTAEVTLIILFCIGIYIAYSGSGPILILMSLGGFVLLFLIGSFLAVRFFVRNLVQITKCRAGSQHALQTAAGDISLDSGQQRVLDVSAKYILLYFLATFSTILSFALSFGTWFTTLEDLRFVFAFLDYSFNILCLYLQFSFAADHYQCLCGCSDKMCRRIVSARTKKAIRSKLTRDLKPATSTSNEAGM